MSALSQKKIKGMMRWRTAPAVASFSGGSQPRRQPSGLPLYHYDDLPAWQQDNCFIHRHYRSGYSTSMTFRSLFSIHNETGNIWTHLVGLLLVIVMTVYMISYLLAPNWMHYAVYFVFTGGACLCMGCSTLFHLFEGNENKKVFGWLQAMDYFGITTHVVGSFIPPIYFVFFCFPRLQMLYLSMVAVVGAVGVLGPFFDFFHAPEFRWRRLVTYVLMIGSGLIPTIHVQFILPQNGTSIPFSVNVAAMFFMYAAGCMFYVTKFPECAFPGRFDLFLHSHQLWHVFSLAATVIHFFTCMGLYQRYKVSGPVC